MTLCNINQGRSSLFQQLKLSENRSLLSAVLRQAYFGSRDELDSESLELLAERVFVDDEVITKGFLADYMFQDTAYRDVAWQEYEKILFSIHSKDTNETYLSFLKKRPYNRYAGWYFKTLAVQEIGKNSARY